MKLDKKSILIVILAVILIAVMIGGTVAWLTASTKIVNTFTVGTFKTPTKSPIVNDETQVTSYLYEPNWDPNNAKLVPGASIDKDPYVGIGKGSEDGIVYVSVENNFSDKVYFTLNTGWEVAEATPITEGGNTYKSGIFKYTAGLEGNAENDVWTTPVFETIEVADDATAENLTVTGDKTITVKCFIHQTGSELSNEQILNAAKDAFTAMDA